MIKFSDDKPKITPQKPMHPETQPSEPKPNFPRKVPMPDKKPSAPIEVPPIKPIDVPIRES